MGISDDQSVFIRSEVRVEVGYSSAKSVWAASDSDDDDEEEEEEEEEKEERRELD